MNKFSRKNRSCFLFFSFLDFCPFISNSNYQKMAPKVKVAWAYAEMIDNQIYCKFVIKKLREVEGAFTR